MTPAQAAEQLASTSAVGSKDKFEALAAAKPEEILKSTDPIISFVVQTQPRALELRQQMAKIARDESAKVQELGRAMYEVYGTSMPPDATFSLRIADGVVKGYCVQRNTGPSRHDILRVVRPLLLFRQERSVGTYTALGEPSRRFQHEHTDGLCFDE